MSKRKTLLNIEEHRYYSYKLNKSYSFNYDKIYFFNIYTLDCVDYPYFSEEVVLGEAINKLLS